MIACALLLIHDLRRVWLLPRKDTRSELSFRSVFSRYPTVADGDSRQKILH